MAAGHRVTRLGGLSVLALTLVGLSNDLALLAPGDVAPSRLRGPGAAQGVAADLVTNSHFHAFWLLSCEYEVEEVAEILSFLAALGSGAAQTPLRERLRFPLILARAARRTYAPMTSWRRGQGLPHFSFYHDIESVEEIGFVLPQRSILFLFCSVAILGHLKIGSRANCDRLPRAFLRREAARDS